MAKLEQFFCMNGGDKEASYAQHSSYQRGVMARAKHHVEDTLTEVYQAISSKCLVVADFGCGSGPNVLLLIVEIMDIIGKNCSGIEMPDVQVFLNDLPSNDFNGIFKSLPGLYQKFEKLNRQCFVAAMPGSFYHRLFPSNSLHFVHSSYALHWLSQVPPGLINENGEALNKGNICATESSSPFVRKMFRDQFEKDFYLFLKLRAEEMVDVEGGMVLTFIGSVHSDRPFSTFEIVGLELYNMANEGLIEKAKVDMFNLPLYMPSAEEIKRVVCNERSFSITELEVFDLAWEEHMPKEVVHVKNGRGEFAAKHVRAAVESLLATAFDGNVIDELFHRLEVKFDEMMRSMECKAHNIIVSLKKMKVPVAKA